MAEGSHRHWYREDGMSVVEVKIQSMEEMYRLIWTAIANKQPTSAIYNGAVSAVLPSPIGSQSIGTASCALLSIRRRERKRSGANGFTGKLALRGFREATAGGVVEWFVEDGAKSLAAGYVCR